VAVTAIAIILPRGGSGRPTRRASHDLGPSGRCATGAGTRVRSELWAVYGLIAATEVLD
jgi:hypothetical protein